MVELQLFGHVAPQLGRELGPALGGRGVADGQGAALQIDRFRVDAALVQLECQHPPGLRVDLVERRHPPPDAGPASGLGKDPGLHQTPYGLRDGRLRQSARLGELGSGHAAAQEHLVEDGAVGDLAQYRRAGQWRWGVGHARLPQTVSGAGLA